MTNFKRARLFLAGALVASCCLTACGSSEKKDTKAESKTESDTEDKASSDTASMSEAQKKAVAAVKLGDYKGISVTIPDGTNASEEDLKNYCDTVVLRGENSFAKDESKTVVGENDIVNVDYQGLKDGKAFDGGTATDTFLDVAGNSDPVQGNGFIDGFTKGLVGAKVGSQVDCGVTFPADYSAADLAGQPVVFRFTVNYICTKMTYDTLTDAFVQEKFESRDVADFKANYLPEKYKSYVEKNKDNLTSDAVAKKVMENATVDDSVDDSVKQEYVFLAVAAAEGMTVDESGFKTYINSIMTTYGAKSEDVVYQAFGGEETMRDYYLATKALRFCVENLKK